VEAPELPRSHGRSLLNLLKDLNNTPWENIAFSEYCMYAQAQGLPYDIHAGPNGWVQRMVRNEEWKLNYYGGMDPQLFNLAEDPHETRDLAQELNEQVLDGWNADEIASKMRSIQRDEQIFNAWAKVVDPPDTYRWNLKPEMDYVDGP